MPTAETTYYLGTHTIAKETKTEDGYILVEFVPSEDGHTVAPQVFAETVLNAVRTTEPKDATYVRDQRNQLIVKDMLEVLLRHNLLIEEFEDVVRLMKTSLSELLGAANAKVWGHPSYQRTILHVHKVLIDQ